MSGDYLKFEEVTIDDFSPQNVTAMYNQGYIFGRPHKGYMYKTKSVRVDLNKFKPSSENRRILRKNESVFVRLKELPYSDYHWSIHKMGKDFYTTKFGKGSMSANKIKSMFTQPEKNNMTHVFEYKDKILLKNEQNRIEQIQRSKNTENKDSNIAGDKDSVKNKGVVGYCLCYKNDEILHYCHPFYDLAYDKSSLGIGMMTKAIVWAKEQGLKYVYLGSYEGDKSKYKMQFRGVELI